MASKVVDARKLISKIDKSGKKTFSADEVKTMLMEEPVVDAHICVKPRSKGPIAPNGIETIKKEDNKMLMGQFVQYVGYDYHTNYDPHLWPDWSPETLELWKEIEFRLKESRTMNFDDKGCIEELKKAVQAHKEIIKKLFERHGDLSDVSWRDGIIDGFESAINSIKRHIYPREDKRNEN